MFVPHLNVPLKRIEYLVKIRSGSLHLGLVVEQTGPKADI